jgi:hypothetical protein
MRGVRWSGSEQFVGCCECGNEPWGSTGGGLYVDERRKWSDLLCVFGCAVSDAVAVHKICNVPPPPPYTHIHNRR